MIVGGCADHALGTDPDDEHSGAELRALIHAAARASHCACGCEGGR